MLSKIALALTFVVAAIATGFVSIDVSVNGRSWTTSRPVQESSALE